MRSPLKAVKWALLEVLLDRGGQVIDRKSVLLEGHNPEPDVEANQDQDEGSHAGL